MSLYETMSSNNQKKCTDVQSILNEACNLSEPRKIDGNWHEMFSTLPEEIPTSTKGPWDGADTGEAHLGVVAWVDGVVEVAGVVNHARV